MYTEMAEEWHRVAKDLSSALDSSNLSHLLQSAGLVLMELKASSRTVHLGVDGRRQLVQDQKKKLDAHHLQLQNLLYRKHHLLREMRLCRDFT